jgi:hypothetical protein
VQTVGYMNTNKDHLHGQKWISAIFRSTRLCLQLAVYCTDLQALEKDEWSAARPGRTLPPGKTRYPFYRSLGGPQGRFERAENLVLTGIRSRTVQPVVGCYTDWATRPIHTHTHTHIHTHTCTSLNFMPYTITEGDRVSTVVSTVVKVLCYKSVGRWFDSRWCNWNFSLKKSFRSHYGPGVWLSL